MNRLEKRIASVLLIVTLAYFITPCTYAQTFTIVPPPDNPSTDVTSTSSLHAQAIAPNLFDGDVTAADIDVKDLTTGGGGGIFAALDQGPTGVFIDNNTSITTNWIAYANRDLANDFAGKTEFWFSDTDFGGVLPTTPPDAVVEDLLDVASPTVFNSYPLVSSFSGRYAALKIFAAPGAILFPGGHEFRFLQGPEQFKLEVNAVTGEIVIKNASGPLAAQSLSINGYEIASEAGSLTSTGWTGLGGQPGFPAATLANTGDGWEQGAASGNDGSLLAEAYLTGSSNVGVGAELSIGTGYDTTVGAQDLSFSYSLDNGNKIIGAVEYIRPEADYDLDGDVDGNDFLFWQRDMSTNNGSAADLAIWQSQYGTGVGSLSSFSASSVPEPGSSALEPITLAFSAVLM